MPARTVAASRCCDSSAGRSLGGEVRLLQDAVDDGADVAAGWHPRQRRGIVGASSRAVRPRRPARRRAGSRPPRCPPARGAPWRSRPARSRRYAATRGPASARSAATSRPASGTGGAAYGTRRDRTAPFRRSSGLARAPRASSSAALITSSEGVASRPGPIAPLGSRSSSRRVSGARFGHLRASPPHDRLVPGAGERDVEQAQLLAALLGSLGLDVLLVLGPDEPDVELALAGRVVERRRLAVLRPEHVPEVGEVHDRELEAL